MKGTLDKQCYIFFENSYAELNIGDGLSVLTSPDYNEVIKSSFDIRME